MSNPFLQLQNDSAARLAQRASLADIPMITEELGNVIKRVETSLVKGGIKESPALAALADPVDFLAGLNWWDLKILSFGSAMWNGDTYTYAISYQTAEGETALSNAYILPTSPADPNFAARLVFDAPPARTTAIRLWRSSVSASDELSLLASLDPDATSYTDTETHAAFAARLDDAILAPVANTTARAKRAGCAMIIHTPSGAGRGNTRTASEQTITVRVEIFFKLLINDSASGLQKVPLQVLWDVICQMVGWNTGPGQSPVELGNYGVLENNAGELNYFADFQVPVTLTIE